MSASLCLLVDLFHCQCVYAGVVKNNVDLRNYLKSFLENENYCGMCCNNECDIINKWKYNINYTTGDDNYYTHAIAMQDTLFY